jgi:putative protease
MQPTRYIELLAPAKNLQTGITAINHGADAVYIGASQFGARQAAGNSVEDITRLVEYAHIYGVKVYVTLNTIIRDEEIADVEKLVSLLYDAGVDALIVQDMGILRMNIPPIPLHASTQMDNRTVEKTRFLASVGFPRVVLARELTLQQIGEIHKANPETELEVFVHGALCVSYSGQCYASQHCFGRSANRGACAQFCRLPFDLVDAEGTIIAKDKHLLSLKDMNRSDYLEEMLDAGVTSLKIEGRLKDESYVKNITAYYRARLDELFARRKEYARASSGRVYPQFTPSPEKSFSRGFTDYMLKNGKENIASFDTPKSMGEYMGRVKFVSRNFFTVMGKDFNNGDGACFIASNGKLCGFRINRVEGNRVFPQTMPRIESGDELYRNYDCAFERELSRPDVQRRLQLELLFADSDTGFRLTATDSNGIKCTVEQPFDKERARSPQTDNIINQLKKWGNTPFEVEKVKVELCDDWFVPSSLLSDMRRTLCSRMTETLYGKNRRTDLPRHEDNVPFLSEKLDYKGNVSNRLAWKFYESHGVSSIAPAFEIEPVEKATVMFCKHCIRMSMGLCSKNGTRMPYKEPLCLVSNDGKRFRLKFDCKECQMHVIAE